MKTALVLITLISTTAFASKKVDLVADLQCKAVDKHGDKVHVHIDGVYNKLVIGKKKYDLVKQKGDDGTITLKAEHKSHEAIIELSDDNTKFKISVDGDDKLKGVCRDTLSGGTGDGTYDGDDDSEHSYGELFGDHND